MTLHYKTLQPSLADTEERECPRNVTPLYGDDEWEDEDWDDDDDDDDD